MPSLVYFILVRDIRVRRLVSIHFYIPGCSDTMGVMNQDLGKELLGKQDLVYTGSSVVQLRCLPVLIWGSDVTHSGWELRKCLSGAPSAESMVVAGGDTDNRKGSLWSCKQDWGNQQGAERQPRIGNS